jgi:hypothetical protein
MESTRRTHGQRPTTRDMSNRDLKPDHVWMAAWVEDVAGQYGQVETIERIAAAISKRVGEDLLSLQWLMRGFLEGMRGGRVVGRGFPLPAVRLSTGDDPCLASYQQFGLSSDFLHDPFMGVGVFAVDDESGVMHVDLNPDVRVGLVALRDVLERSVASGEIVGLLIEAGEAKHRVQATHEIERAPRAARESPRRC